VVIMSCHWVANKYPALLRLQNGILPVRIVSGFSLVLNGEKSKQILYLILCGWSLRFDITPARSELKAVDAT
jgi:hypothetical protein